MFWSGTSNQTQTKPPGVSRIMATGDLKHLKTVLQNVQNMAIFSVLVYAELLWYNVLRVAVVKPLWSLIRQHQPFEGK